MHHSIILYHTTYQNTTRTITSSKRAAPKTEPITIAAISPPERLSDCESALPVTVGVMVGVGAVVIIVVMVVVTTSLVVLDIVEDGAMGIAKAT